MRSLYATRFFIDDASFTDVHDSIARWAKKSVRQRGAALDYDPGGEEQQTPDGHRLRAHEQEIGGGRVVEVEWEHPDKDDADLLWNTRLTLAAAGEKVEFGCLLRIGSRSFRVSPLGAISAGAPGIVGELLRQHECRVSPVQIAAKHTRISPGEADLLVPFLLSGDRALPIVLVSQDNETGEPLADPKRVQKRLSGLAHVYEITGEAGFELTDALGKTSSCFNGAVRVYWPGFTPSAWRQHPLYLPDRVQAIRTRGRRVEDELFRLLSDIAASRFDDGELWRSLRAQANRKRQEDIRRRLDEESSEREPSEDLTEFYKDYEATLKKVDHLDAHNAELAQENARLLAENAGLRTNLSTLTQFAGAAEADVESAGEEAEPETVSEALEQAAAHHACLDVWESATASAAESVSNRAGRVRDALDSIAKLSRLYFATPDRSIGESFKSFFDKQGVKYAPQESEMTMQQYGSDRIFRDGSSSREIQQHLTLGQGSRANCVQIYFDADTDSETFIIGYCGIHLATAGGSF